MQVLDAWTGKDWDATQAAAAWAQALLSVGAVALAAWLQDRALEIRRRASDRHRLEAVATVARHSWSRFSGFTANLSDGMDPDSFRNQYQRAAMGPIFRTIRSLPVWDTGEDTLVNLVMELEMRLLRANAECRVLVSWSQRTNQAVNGESRLSEHSTEIFNAASAIERTVATINRRSAAL